MENLLQWNGKSPASKDWQVTERPRPPQELRGQRTQLQGANLGATTTTEPEEILKSARKHWDPWEKMGPGTKMG